MAQDVKLKLGIDVADAEKAFSSLIKKIQADADKLKFTPSTAAASKGNAIQSARDQERNLTKEKMVLDSINKTLEIRKKHLEDIYKIEAKTTAEIVNKQRAEERAVARLNHAKTVGAMQQTNYNAAQAKMRTSMGLSNGQQPGSVGGVGPSMGTIIGGVLGAVGIQQSAQWIAKEAIRAYDFEVTQKANLNIASGSAVSTNVGYLNQSMLSGNITKQALLQNQMPEARKTATEAFETVGNKMQKFLAVTDLMFDPEGKRMKAYNTRRANEIGEGALKQAEATLEQNNPQRLAEGFFQQTFNRNLNAERALGLGSDQFKKMQMQMNNNGFLTDQGVGMLNQVQSSGGSASGGQAGNIANLGLGMQRGFNLTNAGNILGKLSGLNGSTESGFSKIDEASSSILEKAITKGFNKSENTEIMRRFVESSANLVYNAEAKTPEDIDRITNRLSGLLSGNPTTKQFEAAQSADARYQSMTNQTSGRGGTLGFASMMGSGFSKLTTMQRGNLANLEEGNITSTNSDIIAAAVQQGVSPEVMAERLRGAKRQTAMGTIGLSAKQLAPLTKYLGNRDPLSLLENGGAELAGLEKSNPAVYKAFQSLQERSGITTAGGDTDENRKAMMRKMFGSTVGPMANTGEAARILKNGTAGKNEEEYVAAQAAQEKQLVLNLKALEGGLMPTVKGIGDLTQVILQLGTAAHMLVNGELGAALSRMTPMKMVDTKESMGRIPASGSKPNAGHQ